MTTTHVRARRTAERRAAAARVLEDAISANSDYPPGHDDRYRFVLRPVEELGISCARCGALIDASDTLDLMIEEAALEISLAAGYRAAAQAAVNARWTCENCDTENDR
jgi:hypothetical protein